MNIKKIFQNNFSLKQVEDKLSYQYLSETWEQLIGKKKRNIIHIQQLLLFYQEWSSNNVEWIMSMLILKMTIHSQILQ